MIEPYKLALEMDSYIADFGEEHSRWRCGITVDPHRRLFKEHCVNRGSGLWIYRDAKSSLSAQQISILLRAQGCQGPPDSELRYAYAYLITPSTQQ